MEAPGVLAVLEPGGPDDGNPLGSHAQELGGAPDLVRHQHSAVLGALRQGAAQVRHCLLGLRAVVAREHDEGLRPLRSRGGAGGAAASLRRARRGGNLEKRRAKVKKIPVYQCFTLLSVNNTFFDKREDLEERGALSTAGEDGSSLICGSFVRLLLLVGAAAGAGVGAAAVEAAAEGALLFLDCLPVASAAGGAPSTWTMLVCPFLPLPPLA